MFSGYSDLDSYNVSMQNVLAFYEYIVNDPHHRYRSWDHCYSYFQGLVPSSTKKDIDLASVHLAFYLASWGMYRGSSFIIWKDYQIHIPTIRTLLEQQYRPLRNLDVNTVRTENATLKAASLQTGHTIQKRFSRTSS